jgi:hypothetical protein
MLFASLNLAPSCVAVNQASLDLTSVSKHSSQWKRCEFETDTTIDLTFYTLSSTFGKYI